MNKGINDAPSNQLDLLFTSNGNKLNTAIVIMIKTLVDISN